MASYPLTWLADVLRDGGCTVIEEGDWRHRGRDGTTGPYKSIQLHHDASPPGETSNGADVLINGRDDLAGPLCHLWLDYDGRWHIIAAGRANHAGEGGPWGVVGEDQGNAVCIGIETDHTTNEQWTASQRSEGIKGVAALCRKLGITTQAEINAAVLAHKEYAPTRKIDPDPLDMDQARANLFAYLNGQTGVLGMTDVTAFSRDTDQNVSSTDTWKTLRLDDEGDGALSLLTGPADAYMVVSCLTLTDLEPGRIAQFRFVKVIDYSGDRETVVDVGYPIQEIHGTGGNTYGQITWANNLGGKTDDGGLQKLRLQALAPDEPYVVSRLVSRVLS